MDTGYEVDGMTLTIRVPKELDHHLAEKVRREAEAIMEGRLIKHIIFDFKNTDFMDSSGIGVIIGRCRAMHLYGGKVDVCNVGERIQRILKVSGLEQIVGIVEEN